MPVSHGISAISCGYNHEDMEFFGAIIPHSLLPTPPKWNLNKHLTLRAREKISEIVDRVGIPRLWWLTFHDVLPKICIPDSLEKQFLLIGIDHRDLGSRMSKRLASKGIRSVMRMLNIKSKVMPPIGDQLVEFWYRSWRKAGLLKW